MFSNFRVAHLVKTGLNIQSLPLTHYPVHASLNQLCIFSKVRVTILVSPVPPYSGWR